ncbi:hypothetical protein BG005_010619 [Podila minutissima]|nr:hypothetical protein BG005_010619 [Podila minutissima]
METIFMMVYIRRTLFCHPDMVKNLWVTGHSLGGALASIFMARLQTTVCKDDPLVCGLKEDDQEYFVGSTVLESEQSEEDRKIIGILEGCTVCKDQSNDTGPGRCENCYSDCGGCGSGTCVSCKVGKYSTYCKDIKNSTLVNLRDCYTFGSPKVGDTEFAKEFATNQEKVHAKGPFKPKYWRVANEYDPVTRLPPTRDGYAGKPASGHKSSLLDYQHIGHLVPLQTKRNRENAINHSTGKEETKLLDKIQAPLRWPRSAADFLIGSLTSHSTSEYNTNLFVCSPVTPDTETADTETADTETAVQDTEIATQDTEIAAQDTETPVRNTEALLQNTVPLP